MNDPEKEHHQKELEIKMSKLVDTSAISRLQKRLDRLNSLGRIHDRLRTVNAVESTSLKIGKCMEPALNSNEALHLQFQNATKPQFDFSKLNELGKELNRSVQPIIEFQSVLQQRLEPYKKAWDSLGGIVEEVGKTIAPSIIRFNDILERVPVVTKEALLLMAENGWFVDPELTISFCAEFLSAHEDGDINEIETALVDFFEERCGDIHQDIVARFPLRASVLDAAFSAHQNGQYDLSVPVFLAQADGVSNELFGKHYFRNNERKDIARYVNQLIDASYDSVLLAPLCEKSHFPISKPGNGKNVRHLNRHAILHGDFVDYGTKENSLKAMSFLNYIAVVFGDAVEKPEPEKG